MVHFQSHHLMNMLTQVGLDYYMKPQPKPKPILRVHQNNKQYIKLNDAITITFGDQAENHVGMQQFGRLAETGFDFNDLLNAKNNFESLGAKCKLVCLNDAISNIDFDGKNDLPNAYILVVRNGIDMLLRNDKQNTKQLYQELDILDWDKKYYAYGGVKNKIARYNLCFANNSQEPDYENKKGRVISYNNVESLQIVKEKLVDFFGEKSTSLVAEGNRYYNVKECGIGFHGDGERKKVIGLRIGSKFPLLFQWFINSKQIGERIEFQFSNGDLYVMSEKATGFDWKKRKIATLRHAAGCAKYTIIKNKK